MFFIKKKPKRCCVNLEHVFNSSDLYMSFCNLKSKQSDKFSCCVTSFEWRSPKSKLLDQGQWPQISSQLVRMGRRPWRRACMGPSLHPSLRPPNRCPFCCSNPQGSFLCGAFPQIVPFVSNIFNLPPCLTSVNLSSLTRRSPILPFCQDAAPPHPHPAACAWPRITLASCDHWCRISSRDCELGQSPV